MKHAIIEWLFPCALFKNKRDESQRRYFDTSSLFFVYYFSVGLATEHEIERDRVKDVEMMSTDTTQERRRVT